MNQNERRIFLINYLLKENPNYSHIKIPSLPQEQRQLLRGLMNVRMPKEADEAFIKVQDEYLSELVREKGVITLEDIEPVKKGIYLWQGDITRLGVDSIVNAANSGMTGCYRPNHNCIDNCIHTFAGIQLRLECQRIMDKQGYEEPTGQAKLTAAYNLSCKYIIHTVGPIVGEKVSKRDEELLESCYKACLDTARENNIKSIAFCCISTGVFHFPNKRAAEIAIATVEKYRGDIKVIFNVFKDEDYEIYRELLG